MNKVKHKITLILQKKKNQKQKSVFKMNEVQKQRLITNHAHTKKSQLSKKYLARRFFPRNYISSKK